MSDKYVLYEISRVRENDDNTVEVLSSEEHHALLNDPDEPLDPHFVRAFWSLYGCLGEGQGVEYIGDYTSQYEARRVLSLILGRPIKPFDGITLIEEASCESSTGS